MSVSSVLSQISPPIATETSGSGESVSKTDFLKLLVTQLQKQDPLNPQDPTEFTSQLTQFSSLEQLMKVNDSIATLAGQQTQTSALGSASYIGHKARVEGNTVQLTAGASGPLHYELGADSTATTLNVYDSGGNLVQTVNLGAQATGAHDYQWNGQNAQGTTMPNGTYRMEIAAQDASQQDIGVATSVTGTITSVQFTNGAPQVEINGKTWPIGSLDAVW